MPRDKRRTPANQRLELLKDFQREWDSWSPERRQGWIEALQIRHELLVERESRPAAVPQQIVMDSEFAEVEDV